MVNYFSYDQIFTIIKDLTIRNIKIRYRQALIGIIWAFLKPATTVLVFLIVFKYIIQLNIKTSVSYELFLLSGIIPWFFFAQSISDLSLSHLDNPTFLTKIYLPKYIVPTSYLGMNVIELIIGLVCYLLISIIFFQDYSWKMFLIFIPIVIFIIFTFFVGLALSVMMIFYRDFKHIIPIFIQAGIFISPIGYSSEIVPESFKMFYFVNPITGFIEFFRLFTLSDYSVDMNNLLISLLSSISIIIICFLIYLKKRSQIAEIV